MERLDFTSMKEREKWWRSTAMPPFGSDEYKSTSGFTAFYAGFPAFWLTVRQPFIALSTAEAELLSVMDGVAATRRVSSLVEELEEKGGEKGSSAIQPQLFPS